MKKTEAYTPVACNKHTLKTHISRLAAATSFALCVAATPMANASGLYLQEAVVANAGTVGAGDAVYTDSAAAMWANPATMSYMGDSLTTINLLALDLEMQYHDNIGDGGETAQSYLPSVAAFHAHKVTDKLHVGLAFGAAGGSSIEYGDDWAGAALLDSITLNVIGLNPSLSYKVNDQWSVGAGLQVSWAAIEATTASLYARQDTDWAFGYNLGVMYRPTENLDLGLSYRSKLEHEFDARLTPSDMASSLNVEIDVPDIVDLSARYGVTEDLNLLATVQFHRWSIWDETVLDFNRTPLNGVPIKRDWDDVWKFAIGADYRLNSDWRLKAGFSYETSPQDDPTLQWVDLPVGEQYRYSVGASTNWDDTHVDFFYEYADLGDVDMQRAGLDGSFDGRIHFLGVNFSF